MMKKRHLYIGTLLVAAFFLSSCDYMHKVYVRGEITDISGQALPGVVVRVRGTDFETLSNARGLYSLGATTGTLQLDFLKTGYTPAQLEITVESLGRTEAPTVMLWNLPVSEGVYFYENYRYYETNHPRPNHYAVKDMGNVWGTPVNPELVIPWRGPQSDFGENPPCMIGHKVSAYDGRMHKMQRVNAAVMQTSRPQSIESETSEKIEYPEEIWIAEKSLALHTNVLDEPGKLLVELRAAAPLEPGVYAIHWGALEGYDSIEPRIFMFHLKDPAEDIEGEGESVVSDEGESAEEITE